MCINSVGEEFVDNGFEQGMDIPFITIRWPN
jgi:hypothetical protein